MKKKGWIGLAAVLVVVAVAGAYLGGTGRLKSWVPAAAMASAKDKKPDVPLSFAAREVVQPALAQLADVIEFSGPLVAPSTATVRAKTAGT
ncbi:MAG: efflux RND transporter periplasmic adaptor subunit, partial [Rubrivivax sp.]|nr:efflux RND transporter periplasmic adaptor subunit [Rubrivivax sp.]